MSTKQATEEQVAAQTLALLQQMMKQQLDDRHLYADGTEENMKKQAEATQEQRAKKNRAVAQTLGYQNGADMETFMDSLEQELEYIGVDRGDCERTLVLSNVKGL